MASPLLPHASGQTGPKLHVPQALHHTMGKQHSKQSSSAQAGSMDVTVVPTKPIEGQKPGTSGLRKKTKVSRCDHWFSFFHF